VSFKVLLSTLKPLFTHTRLRRLTKTPTTQEELQNNSSVVGLSESSKHDSEKVLHQTQRLTKTPTTQEV
jgi:hypothetical protein